MASRQHRRGFILTNQKPSFTLKSKHSSKLRKDADVHVNRPPTSLTSSSKNVKRNSDVNNWTPTGLSEEEQLSWAKMESQRLAQVEERARKQEEADLELAIRLSQMEPN